MPYFEKPLSGTPLGCVYRKYFLKQIPFTRQRSHFLYTNKNVIRRAYGDVAGDTILNDAIMMPIGQNKSYVLSINYHASN